VARRNHKGLSFGAALVIALSAADDLLAQERIPIRIPAGGERSLMSFGDADRACHAHAPAVRIVQAPSKGAVRIALRKEPIKRVGHPCHGRMVDHQVLLYTPRDDTVTSDFVAVHRSGTPTNPRDQTYGLEISIFKPAPGASTAPINRLPSVEATQRGEGTYEGGIPMSQRSRDILRSATAPSQRPFPRSYQNPPVPMLRAIPAR
jgi:hypothetical protein